MDLLNTAPASSELASAVFSGGEIPIFSGKTRSACDRCHSQKLRCIRERRQVSCKRCLRLRKSCRYSPRAPRASLKSPKQVAIYAQDNMHESLPLSAYNSTSVMVDDVENIGCLLSPNAETGIFEGVTSPSNPCYPLQNGSSNMQDMSWPGFLLNPLPLSPLDNNGYTNLDFMPITDNIMNYISKSPSLSVSNSHQRIETYSRNNCSETSQQSAAQQLACLNVALDECAVNLPSMNTKDANSLDTTANGGCSSRHSRILVIDELFRLSDNFVDVLKYLSRAECETSSPTDPKQPNAQMALSVTSYGQQLHHASRPVSSASMKSRSRSFSNIDEATMFMVVSCHCRLAKIYTSIFQMMQACIEFSLAPQKGNDWAVVLPKLQVGSLISPPVHVDAMTVQSSTTSSMYILTITMLSSQLWDQLADLLKLGQEVSVAPESASPWALMHAAWDNVMAKTDCLTQIITATKHLLQRHSVVLG